MVAPAVFVPFIFHWYNGEVPPWVGVAVNVTEFPAHMGFAEAPIDTLTARTGFTVMDRVFEVAGLPVAQVAFDVRIHVMASLLFGV